MFALCSIILQAATLSLLLFATIIAFDRDTPIHCYYHGDNLRCGKEESSSLSSKRWANVLGIGPSKTGTTALFLMLAKHSNVTSGDSVRGNVPCCGAELYFWDEPDRVDIGLRLYEKFFVPRSRDPAAYWAIEKTPQYSSSTLAPYLARTLLPRDTKLIFTVRNVFDKDVSLYYYRNTYGRYKADYAEWLKPRIEGYRKWIHCREAAFNEMLLVQNSSSNNNSSSGGGDGSWARLSDLLNPHMFSWETASVVESRLFTRCRDGAQWRGAFTFPNDLFQELLYAQNLRRWASVFGTDNLLCVHSEDYTARPVEVQRLVSDFLQLSDSGWREYVPQAHPETAPSLKLKMQRGSQQFHNGKRLLFNALTELSDEYSHDSLLWFRRICPRLFAEDFESTNSTAAISAGSTSPPLPS